MCPENQIFNAEFVIKIFIVDLRLSKEIKEMLFAVKLVMEFLVEKKFLVPFAEK